MLRCLCPGAPIPPGARDGARLHITKPRPQPRDAGPRPLWWECGLETPAPGPCGGSAASRESPQHLEYTLRAQTRAPRPPASTSIWDLVPYPLCGYMG